MPAQLPLLMHEGEGCGWRDMYNTLIVPTHAKHKHRGFADMRTHHAAGLPCCGAPADVMHATKVQVQALYKHASSKKLQGMSLGGTC